MRKHITLIASTVGITALVGALALATGGYSTFQAAPPPIQSSVSTATVSLSLSSTGSSGSLSVNAKDIVPGDTIQREVALTNTGTAPIGMVTLGVTTSPSNLLTTSSSDGLQIEAQTCATPWTATSLSDGGYSYQCGGNTTTVIAPEPVSSAASPVPLASLGSVSVGKSTSMVITLNFPSTAGNSYQGLSTVLTYTFIATQVAGSNS